MLPTSVCSTHGFSRNTPEENDETMSTQHQTTDPPSLDSDRLTSTLVRFRSMRMDQDPRHPELVQRGHHKPYVPTHGGPTPFHSLAEESWTQSLSTSSCSCYSGPPHHQHHRSLPSQLSREYQSCSEEESCLSSHKSLDSLSSAHSSPMCSLEQPLSLHSIPPCSDVGQHFLPPYFCSPQGAPCCAQCPQEQLKRGAIVNKPGWPWYHPGARPVYPGDFRLPSPAYTHMGSNDQANGKLSPLTASLCPEQRRVFVTYEVDSDKHVNEVIKFVSVLRQNGFDTHIDIFEQQFRSISKIDFMDQYLSEKGYLIIIIISPKYYSTVTSPPLGHEQDERTFNTVYFHKQLQSEFIQNGSKNFRIIPIVFPGATRKHVPSWLINTNIYTWPRDREDILRRLMRLEKYQPPPIGQLPTIVSIPI